ncbi:MAG TPA: VOC family protein [Gemmatimonadales bacterium]|nr:VOC family protein [Gemmatimonadales bacterium]
MVATAVATGHVGLNVSDLPRSIEFYQQVFGFELKGQSDNPAQPYAFLGTPEALVLTLWQQSQGEFVKNRSGLHHLSFQVPSLAEVRQAQERVTAAGAHIHHGGVVPHSEGSASGGLFFEDPDGIRLEIYAADGAGEAPAPFAHAPTCGFF